MRGVQRSNHGRKQFSPLKLILTPFFNVQDFCTHFLDMSFFGIVFNWNF